MRVEFFEGAISAGQLVDAAEMLLPPRLGEYVEFNVFGNIRKYEIIAVEHVFDSRWVEDGVCKIPETSHLSMRCGLMRLDQVAAFDSSNMGNVC
jgi:hypothetical protein